LTAREYTTAQDQQLFRQLKQLTTAQLIVVIAFLTIRNRADREQVQRYLMWLAQA